MNMLQLTEPDFFAIYNPITLEVFGVYPSHAAEQIDHKIKIDQHLANLIFDGTVPLTTCFVDTTTESPTVIQQKIITKIDDILHRIPDSNYSKNTNPDVIVSYDQLSKQIEISVSDTVKKIKWANETNLKFIVSAYNDPHKIYQLINITLSSLLNTPYTIMYTGPDNAFSVFTSRVFKTYIFENK